MEVKTIKKEKKVQLEQLITFDTTAIEYTPKDKLGITGMTLTADYTRIDFYYRAPAYYTNGGWASMEPKSYIRAVGSENKLFLTGARGIPLTPAKHYFKRYGEILYYSLFFPALPKSVTSIDIIELEKPGHYFNFYDVSVLSKLINVNEELSAN